VPVDLLIRLLLPGEEKGGPVRLPQGEKGLHRARESGKARGGSHLVNDQLTGGTGGRKGRKKKNGKYGPGKFSERKIYSNTDE